MSCCDAPWGHSEDCPTKQGGWGGSSSCCSGWFSHTQDCPTRRQSGRGQGSWLDFGGGDDKKDEAKKDDEQSTKCKGCGEALTSVVGWWACPNCGGIGGRSKADDSASTVLAENLDRGFGKADRALGWLSGRDRRRATDREFKRRGWKIE